MMLTEGLLALVQRFPRSILRRPQAITCQYTLMQASKLLHNQSLDIILKLRWNLPFNRLLYISNRIYLGVKNDALDRVLN